MIAREDILSEVRRALPNFREQFECGRRPITDREIASCVISYDGMAPRGPEGRAALDALRAMPERDAEDLVLSVMGER